MKSLEPRKKIVVVVLFIVAFVSLAAAASDGLLIVFLHSLQNGTLATMESVEVAEVWQGLLGLLQLALWATCAVVFLLWFRRAYENLVLAELEYLEYSPNWAVGGFFVPFLNLVRPFQVMKELWRGSEFLAGGTEAEDWRERNASRLVGQWWGLFLVMGFAGNISGRLIFRAEELPTLLAAEYALLLSDLLEVPAALIAVMLVSRITSFQEAARGRQAPSG